MMLASSAESVLLWDIPQMKEKTEPSSSRLSVQLTKQWNNSAENTGTITDITWNTPNTTILGVFQNYGPIFFGSVGELTNTEQTLKNTSMVGQKCIALGAKDRIIAAAGQDNLLHVYHLTGSSQTTTLSGHSSSVTTIQFNDNGSHIASGSDNGEIILNNMLYRDTSTPLLAPRVQAINDLCYSPHKASVLGSVSADGAVNIWDAGRAKLLHSANQIHSASATGLSFFQDKQILASVGLDGELALFDTSTFNTIYMMSLKSALTCVDVCGDLICVGSKQGSLYVFDRRSMKSALVCKESAHKSAITCVKFRKNQGRFSSGSFNLSAHMPTTTSPEKAEVTQPADALGLFSPASANASFVPSDVSCNQSNTSEYSFLWPSFAETSLQLSNLPADSPFSPSKDSGRTSNPSAQLPSPFDLNSMVHRKSDAATPGSSNTQAALLSTQSPQPVMDMDVQHITPVTSRDSSSMNRRKWDVRDILSPTTFNRQGVASSISEMSPPMMATSKVSTPVTFGPFMPKAAPSATTQIHSIPLTAATAAASVAPTRIITPTAATAAASAPNMPSSNSVSFKLLHGVVYDAMEVFTDNVHNDFLRMQMNVLRMMQQQKVEISNGLQQHMAFVRDLIAENQQLKLENRQLRKNY
ncbi:protein NEDD1-like isoform X1 [Octopus vulgaris]|uniref:Protein NEDD1-like isoform X1 n=1 Tax=Octopus vulgaris TaxID=6645 RepID=A0AA36BMM6_OCTVU|nr:protein NEDD1-like isoform X1 [Octopus vulgaris]